MRKYPLLCTFFTALICSFMLWFPQIAQAAPAYEPSFKLADQGIAKLDNSQKTVTTKLLEAGSKILQDTTPIQQLQLYLDGFHNYKSEADLPGEQQHQMRVAHYCQEMNENFIQCAVYDGNTAAAHLIGIEHIISDSVFQGLSETEKKYWHPHISEAETGNLIAPGVPQPAHGILMEKASSTHGKTWHVWDTYQDELPLGEAKLMWAIESDKINATTKKLMADRQRSKEF